LRDTTLDDFVAQQKDDYLFRIKRPGEKFKDVIREKALVKQTRGLKKSRHLSMERQQQHLESYGFKQTKLKQPKIVEEKLVTDVVKPKTRADLKKVTTARKIKDLDKAKKLAELKRISEAKQAKVTGEEGFVSKPVGKRAKLSARTKSLKAAKEVSTVTKPSDVSKYQMTTKDGKIIVEKRPAKLWSRQEPKTDVSVTSKDEMVRGTGRQQYIVEKTVPTKIDTSKVAALVFNAGPFGPLAPHLG